MAPKGNEVSRETGAAAERRRQVPSRRRILSAPALALAALALLASAGCGGGDETAATVATTTVTQTVTAPATTPSTIATTTTGQLPPPDPSAPLALHEAEQLLSEHGYAPLTERDWRPDQALKVLVGIARDPRPAGARQELAFLFVGDRFIGTDTKDPSAQIVVVAQGDSAVTLRYGLYRPSDSVGAPSGGGAQVTYRWTGSRLVPQDPIPTAASDAPLSRR